MDLTSGFNTKAFSIVLPARIVKYYPETQLADIKISAERVFSNMDSKLQQQERQELEGVPVHTPYGGGWSVTFPIKEGDTCLVVFSQIGYDHWLYADLDAGGTLMNQPIPHLRREFSEDDGFVMVGFNTVPRAIDQYSGNHSEWRDADRTQWISLKDDETIEVNSPAKVTIIAPEVLVQSTTAIVEASSKVTLDTPETEITGNLNIPTGTFSLGGVNMNNHIHSQGADSDGDAEVDTTGPHN